MRQLFFTLFAVAMLASPAAHAGKLFATPPNPNYVPPTITRPVKVLDFENWQGGIYTFCHRGKEFIMSGESFSMVVHGVAATGLDCEVKPAANTSP